MTKDYPDDTRSGLGAPGRWRLNIYVGATVFTELLGTAPGEIDIEAVDVSVPDVIAPHPLYGPYGWVSIVNPGPATTGRVLPLHEDDRHRVQRRHGTLEG